MFGLFVGGEVLPCFVCAALCDTYVALRRSACVNSFARRSVEEGSGLTTRLR